MGDIENCVILYEKFETEIKALKECCLLRAESIRTQFPQLALI